MNYFTFMQLFFILYVLGSRKQFLKQKREKKVHYYYDTGLMSRLISMYPEVEYSSEKVTISTEVVEVGRTTAALRLEDFTFEMEITSMAQIHKVQDMRAADSTLQRLQLHTRRHLFPRRHDSQVSLGLLCCTHPVSHCIPGLPSRLNHRAHLFLFSRFFSPVSLSSLKCCVAASPNGLVLSEIVSQCPLGM